jgi:hypothetical protein
MQKKPVITPAILLILRGQRFPKLTRVEMQMAEYLPTALSFKPEIVTRK